MQKGKIWGIRATGEGHVHFNIEKDPNTYLLVQGAASFDNVFSLLCLAFEKGLDVDVINEEKNGEYWATKDIRVFV